MNSKKCRYCGEKTETVKAEWEHAEYCPVNDPNWFANWLQTKSGRTPEQIEKEEEE